jgi:hypothetical protein
VSGGEGGFRGGPKNEGQASVCVGAILQNRQTEAARIVTGLTTCATLSSLYAETGWEKLNTRRDIRKLSALFYNIVKGDTPDYLSDLLPRTVNQANNSYYSFALNVYVEYLPDVNLVRSFYWIVVVGL